MKISYKQTPNKTGRNGKKPLYIVLHSTGGSYEGAVAWLTNPDSGVSAHYVISRDGDITQLCQCSEQTWHAGKSSWEGHRNLNDISIGIEMAHVDGVQDWPDKQVKAVAYICGVLLDKFGIPEKNIIFHSDIAPGRKVDPVGFDKAKLLELIK
ncbi:MAG: N-acetylmuramoyl-L-alanine amidase [Legionellales bacterium]|jgi:N-acetylmuramoyl-L-alanine amidase